MGLSAARTKCQLLVSVDTMTATGVRLGGCGHPVGPWCWNWCEWGSRCQELGCHSSRGHICLGPVACVQAASYWGDQQEHPEGQQLESGQGCRCPLGLQLAQVGSWCQPLEQVRVSATGAVGQQASGCTLVSNEKGSETEKVAQDPGRGISEKDRADR